jgi:glycosyltransferase involved in cell wall biosynthesis
MKKNNYLAVHLLNDFSGSPLVLANCIDSLTDDGHRVELLTNGDVGFLSRCSCNRTVINYRRYNHKILTLMFFVFCQFILFLTVLSKTLFVKKDDKPKVIINTVLPFGAALGAKLTGCHIVYYVHEVSIRPLLLKRWLKFILKTTADEAIYVSNYLKENEGGHHKAINEIVIYNSLPPKLDVLSSNTPNSDFIVFMPSSLKTYKGVYNFVEIADKLKGTNARFILALNADEPEFNAFINSFKSLKNIEILRRPSDINSIYSRASLVLNLSHPCEWVETFGMTVIEGFAHGCPVIVPTIGGIAEIVSEGNDGFKISVTDSSAICSKIIELAEDEVKFEKLKLNALISAKKFEYPEYKRIILEVLL